MKNQVVYQGNAFEFYKKVKSKKHDKDLKGRLGLIEDTIKQLFDNYDNHFENNNLQLLEPHVFTPRAKEDLEALYSYSSKTLTDLRIALTTTPSGRNVKCQYCTISAINTFDHLVPQGAYAEFNVHPKNLFCSCGDCNPRKGAIWRKDGQRTTLNLYLDQLPQDQYLFVKLDVQDNSIGTQFYLYNAGNIDDSLFKLLEEHYKRLDLFRRFSESADTVITSFIHSSKPTFEIGTPDNAKTFILKHLQNEKKAFGHNYWETILKIELLEHPDFLRLMEEMNNLYA